MGNLEACEEGKIKEEELFGKKIILCYSKECPYHNKTHLEFDGYRYPICESSGLVSNKLVDLTQNTISI